MACSSSPAFVVAFLLLFGQVRVVTAAHASRVGNLQYKEIESDNASRAEIVARLVAAVDGYMGKGTEAAHVTAMRDQLKPLFNVLPKNRYGFLGHAAARYALHRHFVHRRMWNIKGLEPSSLWTEDSDTIPKASVPAYVQYYLEEQMGGVGFGLPDLAVFAAGLETIIEDDVHYQLREVFVEEKVSTGARLHGTDADKMLEAFLARRLLGAAAARRHADANQAWPGPFAPILKFAKEQRASLEPSHPRGLDFKSLVKLAGQADEKVGDAYKTSCQHLRGNLLNVGSETAGVVGHAAFTESHAVGDQWRLSESAEELKELTTSFNRSSASDFVVVPNYVYSTSNCIQTAGYYAVCCPNECEGLAAQVEAQVGASEAEPERLAGILSSLGAGDAVAGMHANALSARLKEIAAWHMGAVPLHGRLFSQLMHTAFPGVCPLPRFNITLHPITADEWMRATGFVQEDIVRMYITADGQREDVDEEEDWVDLDETQDDNEDEDWRQEEVFVARKPQAHRAQSGRGTRFAPSSQATRDGAPAPAASPSLTSGLGSLLFMGAAVVAMVRSLASAALSGKKALGRGEGKLDKEMLRHEKSMV